MDEYENELVLVRFVGDGTPLAVSKCESGSEEECEEGGDGLTMGQLRPSTSVRADLGASARILSQVSTQHQVDTRQVQSSWRCPTFRI
jgi:hypothetical protein